MSVNPFKEIAGREIVAKLKSEEIPHDKVVLTISRAYIQRIGRDVFLAVEFAEFPKKALHCNKTQGNAFQSLVGHGCLPSTFNEITEEFGWEGLSVPLYKRTNTYTDKGTGEYHEAEKLYPVSPAVFDKSLLDFPRLGNAEVKKVRNTKRRPATK